MQVELTFRSRVPVSLHPVYLVLRRDGKRLLVPAPCVLTYPTALPSKNLCGMYSIY